MKTVRGLKRRSFIYTGGLTGILAALGLNRTAHAGHLEAERFGERIAERYPAFDDARSRKVIFVAHCVINQNARCNGSAMTPSAMPGIAELLIANQIGIAQMPCPELGCLGLGREGMIYDQLCTHGSRRYLRALAQDIVYQARQYLGHGFKVLGVVGINCSPSCGVDCHAYNGEAPGRGAFMEELTAALREDGLELPLIGVADEKMDQSLADLKKLIGV